MMTDLFAVSRLHDFQRSPKSPALNFLKRSPAVLKASRSMFTVLRLVCDTAALRLRRAEGSHKLTLSKIHCV